MHDFDINIFINNLHKKRFGYNIFMFAMGMFIVAIAFLFDTWTYIFWI